MCDVSCIGECRLKYGDLSLRLISCLLDDKADNVDEETKRLGPLVTCLADRKLRFDCSSFVFFTFLAVKNGFVMSFLLTSPSVILEEKPVKFQKYIK